MAQYKLLKLLELKQTVADRKTGELRLTAVFRELQPEERRINLSKSDAATIAQFKALVGRTVMVSAEDGVFTADDGRTFPFTRLVPSIDGMPLVFEAPASMLPAVNPAVSHELLHAKEVDKNASGDALSVAVVPESKTDDASRLAPFFKTSSSKAA